MTSDLVLHEEMEYFGRRRAARLRAMEPPPPPWERWNHLTQRERMKFSLWMAGIAGAVVGLLVVAGVWAAPETARALLKFLRRTHLARLLFH